MIVNVCTLRRNNQSSNQKRNKKSACDDVARARLLQCIWAANRTTTREGRQPSNGTHCVPYARPECRHLSTYTLDQPFQECLPPREKRSQTSPHGHSRHAQFYHFPKAECWNGYKGMRQNTKIKKIIIYFHFLYSLIVPSVELIFRHGNP